MSALTAVPGVTLDQWQATGIVVRWMIASRAAVLIMTFSSAAVGGTLALMAGAFDPVGWVLCTVGLLLAHATNNQLNDLTDSNKGVDEGNYFRIQYGAHVLEDGLLSTAALWKYIVITGLIALAIGVYLIWRTGIVVLWPMVAGAFLLIFYTYPLKKLGLGEPAVLLVWGPLMTGGAYLVSAGVWDWTAALIGTLYALAPTAVIFGKHIDKLEFDVAKGVRTLPVRLGAGRSRRWVIWITAVQYVAIPVLALLGVMPWTMLVVFLAVPQAWRLITVALQERPAECPPQHSRSAWPLWYAAYAFAHARSYGLLFLIGLLLAWAMGAVPG